MSTTPITHSITRLQIAPTASRLQRARKIGVALGAGIPEGFADIGLLIALSQLRISIDAIAGTSIGAFIGALYASGIQPERIKDLLADRFQHEDLRGEVKGIWGKAILGQKDASDFLSDLFVDLTGWDPDFRDLKVPLFVVAADKTSQQPIIIRHGSVKNALKATMMSPAAARQGEGSLKGGLQLADGSVFSPLPGDILYAEECDYVFGIQAKVIQSEKKRDIPFVKRLEPQMLKILGWETNTDVSFSKAGCDVLVRPRIPQAMLKEEFSIEALAEKGMEITYDAMTEIEQTESDLEKSVMRREARIMNQGSSRTNGVIDEQFDDIVEYLKNFGEHIKDFTDAELMDIFPSFTRIFQVFWDRMITEYPDTEQLREVLQDRFPTMVEAINDSPFFKRCLDKPQGYAGDYQMMNYVYDDTVFEATSNLAKLFNYYIFDGPAANAVKNRAKIIHGVVQQRLSQLGSLSIASIASGPAREIPTTIHLLEGMPGRIQWTLLDQDADAMAYAKSNMPKEDQLTSNFISAGVLELVRKRVDLGPQDIIYSLGLFDYLNDKVATKVIAELYEKLNPGGVMLIGNFADHIVRPIMEAAMDWHLIYRTHEDCLRLAKAGAPDSQHYVMSEPAGVNLIIVISKPIQPFA